MRSSTLPIILPDIPPQVTPCPSNTFDFLLPSDQSAFSGEMLNLRNAYCNGRITSLFAGEPLDINGTPLYPIKVMYQQSVQCGAYFLIHMHDKMSDLEKTPYFFVRESECNETLGWLTKEQCS